jgi:hypothetical protein
MRSLKVLAVVGLAVALVRETAWYRGFQAERASHSNHCADSKWGTLYWPN